MTTQKLTIDNLAWLEKHVKVAIERGDGYSVRVSAFTILNLIEEARNGIAISLSREGKPLPSKESFLNWAYAFLEKNRRHPSFIEAFKWVQVEMEVPSSQRIGASRGRREPT